ncbi:MAG: CHRD domain-containing protein [Gemmatimonadales bacterium]
MHRVSTVVLGALLFAVGACDDDEDNGTGPSNATSFTATLSGANERPNPVTTTATGSATFTLNESTQTFTYSITVNALTNVTAAHIHVGTTAAAGPIVVNLLPQAPAPGTINGQLVSATFTASGIATTVPISFAGLLSLMREGSAYVNVHTQANPGGEIRGQIVAQE